MRNFSKLFGAMAGTAVGQGIGEPLATLLTGVLSPDKANAVGKLVEIALPLLGVYLAPANRPIVQQPQQP